MQKVSDWNLNRILKIQVERDTMKFVGIFESVSESLISWTQNFKV